MTTTGSLSPHINPLLLHTALRLADCHVGLKVLFRRVFPIPIPAHVIVDVGRGASEVQLAERVVKCIGCDVAAAGLASGRASGMLTAVEGVSITSIRSTLFSAAETPSWSRLRRGRYQTLCIRPFARSLVRPSTHTRWSAAAHCLAPVKACSTSATDIARHSCRLRELAGC
ncbi:hypothetical protein C8F01DRAFT_1176853 [Mycena amicta]|nr:hypothetical protein C8F01DRAFT_1176853 [Mycena amicta]